MLHLAELNFGELEPVHFSRSSLCIAGTKEARKL